MKRSKKNPKTEELCPPVEQKSILSTGFGLKITNLRKTAYPYPLEETDYHQIKVGDFMKKGKASNLYEVIAINREAVTEQDITNWSTGLCYGNGCRDTRIKNLIDEYIKKGNFGACSISLRLALKGSKVVAGKRSLKIMELDNTWLSKGVLYKRVDLDQIIYSHDMQAGMYRFYIERYKTKILNHENIKTAIIGLKTKAALKQKKQSNLTIVGKEESPLTDAEYLEIVA